MPAMGEMPTRSVLCRERGGSRVSSPGPLWPNRAYCRRQDMSEAYTGGGNAAALGAADWLCLAAAPTFAITAYGCSWWRPVGYALLGRARCVIAERNGPDVLADECLPFGALAEADLQPTTASVPISRRPSIHKSLSQVQSELGPREGAGRDMADSIAGQEPEFVPCWIGLPLCSGHRSKSMTLTGSLKRNSHEQRTGQQGRRRPLVHRILG